MKSAIISNPKLQTFHLVMFKSRIAVRKTSPRSVQKLSALHVRLSSFLSTTSRTFTKLCSESRKPKMGPTTKSQGSSLPSPSKPRLLIIGTGWAGWTVAQNLASTPLSQTHTITILSPYRTVALTPLSPPQPAGSSISVLLRSRCDV